MFLFSRLYVQLMVIILLSFFLAPYSFATTWYVDNTAKGINNGSSWDNAWESFTDILWGVSGVKEGDTLYISGGITEKVYNEKLTVGASGSPDYPIIIRAGQDIGHTGVVIITNIDEDYGIWIAGKNYITIDGNYNGSHHIRVTGCGNEGIMVQQSIQGIVLTYLEIDNNGNSQGEDGIELNNVNTEATDLVEISHNIIHNNWQDQIHIVGSRGPILYGRFKIHHNEIYEVQDDGVETAVRGVDIYENTIHTLSYGKGNGNPDGLANYAGNLRMYNNTLYNLYNDNSVFTAYLYAAMYDYRLPAPASGHVRIYNNLVYQDIPGRGNDYGRGILLNIGVNPTNTVASITDVLIANNTIIGMPAWGITISFDELSTDDISDIYVVNNIIHNCNTIGGGQAMFVGSPTAGDWTIGSWGDETDIVIDYNIINAGSQGSTKMSYKGAIYSFSDWKTITLAQSNIVGTPDPELYPSYKIPHSSPVLNTAVNLSSYFDVDNVGYSRPNVPTAWDPGAYQFNSEVSPNRPSNLRIIN